MLPDPPPREPPENPPPPPRALAKETVGTPMSAHTMQEAISFLVITSDCPFGLRSSTRQLSSIILAGMGEGNRRFEGRSTRAGRVTSRSNSSDASHAGGQPAQSQA